MIKSKPNTAIPPRPQRRRRRNPVRVALAVVILIGFFIYQAVPALISSQAVSEQLSEALSHRLGAKVVIGGKAEISFWPTPKITVTNVALPRPRGSGPLIYGNAKRLSAELDVFSALAGNAVASGITIDSAVIIVEMPEDEDGNPANALAKVVEEIRAGDESIGNAKGPAELEIRNSTVGITRKGDTKVIKGVNGTLKWPILNAAARFSGTAQINGKSTRLALKVDNAAALIAGKTSPVTISVDNNVTHLNYKGTATDKLPYLLNGKLTLSTNKLQEQMAVLGLESRLLQNVNVASLVGDLKRSGTSLSFSPAELTIAGSKGNGVLDVTPSLDGHALGVSATMAFGETSIFDVKSSLPAWIDSVADRVHADDSGVHALPTLDLRLSAGSVKLSHITLQQVAASIIRSKQQTSFDIADSRLGNGTLFAHIGIDSQDVANVHITVEDVKSGPFFKQIGFDVPLDTDSLDLEMTIIAARPLSTLHSDNISGTIAFSAKKGTISWLGIDNLIEKAKTQETFSFSPRDKKEHPFDKISGHADLLGTNLTLEAVAIESAKEIILIDGEINVNTSQFRLVMVNVPKTDNAVASAIEIKGNALLAIARKIAPPPVDAIQ